MSDICPHHSGFEAEMKKICALLDERQKQADLRFSFVKESVHMAKEDMERRLEGMNEFRAQLSIQATTFINRTEMRLEIEKLINRIVLLEKGLNYREGTRHWTDYLITAIIAGAIVVISRLVHL